MDSNIRKIETTNESITDQKLNEISVEELNNRIDASEEDFKNGRYKTTEALLEKYKF